MIALLSSCRVSRNVSTSRQTVDSVARSSFDSLQHVYEATIAFYERMTHDSSTTDVVFENEPCPNIDSIYAILDSAGKARFEVMLKDKQIRELKNKLKVNADGSFEAEGRIKSYRTTAEKYIQENSSLRHEKDSLTQVIKTKDDQLSKTAEVKMLVVKKTFIPWWIWLIIIILGVLWIYGLIPKNKLLNFKSSNMKSILWLAVFAATLSVSGCGKFRGTNTSIWSEIWWIPWVAGVIAAFCWYKTIQAARSGAGRYEKGTSKWVDEGGKAPWYKTWYFIVAAVLTAGIIAMVIGVSGSR